MNAPAFLFAALHSSRRLSLCAACLARVAILLCVASFAGASPVAAGSGTPSSASSLPVWQCDPGGGPACYTTLYGVDAVSPTEAWAVGDHGVILHWDGTRWQRAASPTTETLTAIDMLSSVSGWAVGGHSKGASVALRYDGISWQSAPSGTQAGLRDVSMVTEDDGWAIGHRGGVYGSAYDDLTRWNGASWQVFAQEPAGEDRLLTAIAMSSRDRGWLAAEGTLMRWDGASWDFGEKPWIDGPVYMAALAVDAQGGGWAVGDGFVRLDPLEQWPVRPEGMLNAVRILAPGDAWAVGEQGLIYHWDGTDWRRASTPTGHSLYALTFTSPSDGWAVGASDTILHWDGTAWQAVIAGGLAESFNAVDVLSANAAWAVGDGGVIGRWDGVAWHKVPSPTAERLNDVALLNSHDGWAVGDNRTFLQWDGVVWQRVEAGGDAFQMKSVDILSPSDAWAVGNGGGLGFDYHWDGLKWTVGPFRPMADPLNGVDAVSPTDVWVAGPWRAAIQHWDGVRWTNAAGSTYRPPRAIKMVTSTAGWVVGCTEQFRYDGQGWRYMELPYCLNGVDMTSPVDGWAVGEGGVLLHWDGTTWTASDQLAPTTLNDVSLLSPSEGWAVGAGGLLLHLTAGAQPAQHLYMPLLVAG